MFDICCGCQAGILEGQPYQVWLDYTAYHCIGYNRNGPILSRKAMRIYCGICSMIAPEGKVEDVIVSHEAFAALERELEAEREARKKGNVL